MTLTIKTQDYLAEIASKGGLGKGKKRTRHCVELAWDGLRFYESIFKVCTKENTLTSNKLGARFVPRQHKIHHPRQ